MDMVPTSINGYCFLLPCLRIIIITIITDFISISIIFIVISVINAISIVIIYSVFMTGIVIINIIANTINTTVNTIIISNYIIIITVDINILTDTTVTIHMIKSRGNERSHHDPISSDLGCDEGCLWRWRSTSLFVFYLYSDLGCNHIRNYRGITIY